MQRPRIIGAKWLYALDESLTEGLRSQISVHCDALNMLNTLQEPGKIKNVYACSSIEALNTLHNNLIARINEIKFHEREQTIFESSPFDETKTIRYIPDAQTLHLEGKTQKHCVYSYQQRIVEGMYFVYQYIGNNDRATIGIKRTKNGLEVDQIKGKCNQPVSDAVIDEIYGWFLEEKKSKML